MLRQLKNCAQTLIDGILRSSRQRPDMIREKTAIKGHELRHVYHRVARQTCLARSQQHVPRGIRKLQGIGNHRHDYRLDATAIEGISLDYKHRTPVAGL
jgi:hypothetical protein